MPRTEREDVVVLGAGAAGLAAAATLLQRGVRAIVLERDARVGGTWERRYDRLRLHTTRALSGLPFLPMPAGLPRYVTKDDYARYLAGYARRLGLRIETGCSVERVAPSSGGAGWVLATSDGERRARAVVIATGKHRVPLLPDWDGRARFAGPLRHSADYRNPREHAGLRTLVVGLGNSGAEIAAELAEADGSRVAVSVRSRPPITSREILGVPVQVLGILLAPLPAVWVDGLGARLRRRSPGDLSAHGLGPEAWGPFVARRPPVIDVGFLAQLQRGLIEVRPDVRRLTRRGVVFADGRAEEFDAIVAATGFTSGLGRLLEAPGVLDERELPRCDRAGACALAGLYFLGFDESPRGALFDAGRGARRLARRVARHLREAP